MVNLLLLQMQWQCRLTKNESLPCTASSVVLLRNHGGSAIGPIALGEHLARYGPLGSRQFGDRFRVCP